MKENIALIKQEYENRYSYRCSDELAKELIDIGGNDMAMIVRTIERTDKHYKLKEFIAANAKQKADRQQSRQKRNDAYTQQLKYMYEPFLIDGTIDTNQYNAILAQRQDMTYNRNDYLQGMFNVQKSMYKSPRAWVRGLGLTMWEEQAVANLVPEQQQTFNLELIRQAGVQYQNSFVPDAEMTPATIQRMFGRGSSIPGETGY